MVSVLILGMAVASMVGVFMVGRISIAKADHHMEAINHARAAMEKLIKDPDAIFILPNGAIKNLGGSYSATSTGTGIKKIVVTISWNERSLSGSNAVSEQLTTLVVRK